MKEQITKGYKALNKNWTCRGKKYELGINMQAGDLSMCNNGIHFCMNISDCFDFYKFDADNTMIVEVEAYGHILTDAGGKKSCASRVNILKELSWGEVLRLCNSGSGNSGSGNSGSGNSGDWNSGSGNSGSGNSGDRNSGYKNSGRRNSGHWNSGDCNSGRRNSGSGNSGSGNSGDCNSGSGNSGSGNSGDRNSGYKNSGDYNSGDCNSGYKNSGYRNSGDYNSGDCNSGYRNSGIFNTNEPVMRAFNRSTNLKRSDWDYDWSAVHKFNETIPTLSWVSLSAMTESERNAHPEAQTTGGILRLEQSQRNATEIWTSLTKEERELIESLPNYDEKIFFEIMGIEAK